MLARHGLSVEVRGDEDIVVHAIVEAHVRAVAVIAGEENMFYLRLWLHQFRQCKKSDATPATIEFAPGRDAVKITYVLKLWEGVELVPCECFGMLDQAANFETPFA